MKQHTQEPTAKASGFKGSLRYCSDCKVDTLHRSLKRAMYQCLECGNIHKPDVLPVDSQSKIRRDQKIRPECTRPIRR